MVECRRRGEQLKSELEIAVDFIDLGVLKEYSNCSGFDVNNLAQGTFTGVKNKLLRLLANKRANPETLHDNFSETTAPLAKAILELANSQDMSNAIGRRVESDIAIQKLIEINYDLLDTHRQKEQLGGNELRVCNALGRYMKTKMLPSNLIIVPGITAANIETASNILTNAGIGHLNT